ncbi:MAG: hypothetical protein AAF721_30870 [Myxococcota bacterium]
MLSGLLALALGPPAPEEPHPRDYTLEWSAPASCPDETAVAARIAALRLDPSGEGTLRVEGSVTETGEGRWRLSLRTEFDGVHEVRDDEAATCRALVESTALVVAVALAPVAQRAALSGGEIPEPPAEIAPPSDEAPAPKRTRAASPPVVAGGADRVAARTTRRPRVGLRLDAGPEWGAVGGLAGTVGAGVGAIWPRARVGLSGRWIGVRVQPGPAQAEARVQLGVAALRGCGTPRRGPWVLSLCGALEAGIVRLAPRGFDRAGPSYGPWLAPAAMASVVRKIGRFGLGAEVQTAVPVVRTAALSEGQAFFAPGPVSIRGLLVFEIVLP